MKQKHESKSRKPHQESQQPSRGQHPPQTDTSTRKQGGNDAKVEDDMILRR